MRPELARLANLEQQLLGTQPPVPEAEWQRMLLLDTGLAADAHAQQQLYAGLKLAGRRQLRHELEAIHSGLYGPVAAGWLRRTTARLQQALSRWPRLRPKP
ncbi:hypothetical protein [Solirubrum puertoriconensis]|uniref:Uncharacterized protein n=1 Tax=Solirubrum puertoriconensis TaxID=1751427 RepID=A0A9X0HM74_SOLP1|nr:hypothetical protein [Solirubrum puertoriconensis]KUG08572.1 hypothetical protein ASU33_10485 [Solirubrum puertoriconensis]